MKNTAGVVRGEVGEAGGPDRMQVNRVRIASFQWKREADDCLWIKKWSSLGFKKYHLSYSLKTDWVEAGVGRGVSEEALGEVPGNRRRCPWRAGGQKCCCLGVWWLIGGGEGQAGEDPCFWRRLPEGGAVWVRPQVRGCSGSTVNK